MFMNPFHTLEMKRRRKRCKTITYGIDLGTPARQTGTWSCGLWRWLHGREKRCMNESHWYLTNLLTVYRDLNDLITVKRDLMKLIAV